MAIYVIDPKTGTPQSRGSKQIHWQAGQSTPIEFTLSNEPPGTHQGYIRIMGEDNLTADDVRNFTFDVRPPFRVLVAANKPVEQNSLFLTEACPTTFRKIGRSLFECETISIDRMLDRNLDTFAAVCLLDPPPLEAAVWQRLKTYVESGGGLAIWLGHNARANEAFHDPAALAVLPGKLTRMAPSEAPISPRDKPVVLAATGQDLQHPVMSRFRPIARSVPWSESKVWRHSVFGELDQIGQCHLAL